MKNDPFSWRSAVRAAVALLSATLAASAQMAPPDHPSTATEKVADAPKAGPRFVTKDANPAQSADCPGGEYRLLRQGTSDWTRLPGSPG
jgi:hypothetical protein